MKLRKCYSDYFLFNLEGSKNFPCSEFMNCKSEERKTSCKCLLVSEGFPIVWKKLPQKFLSLMKEESL